MIVLSLHCKKENYINTDCIMNVCKDDASILIIYTGGTIGMIENPETGSLEAFNFEHLELSLIHILCSINILWRLGIKRLCQELRHSLFISAILIGFRS